MKPTARIYPKLFSRGGRSLDRYRTRRGDRYTAKSNLVAVILNGTAVLGLSIIGAQASNPVMESKAIRFKKSADVECFDIEIIMSDPEKMGIPISMTISMAQPSSRRPPRRTRWGCLVRRSSMCASLPSGQGRRSSLASRC